VPEPVAEDVTSEQRGGATGEKEQADAAGAREATETADEGAPVAPWWASEVTESEQAEAEPEADATGTGETGDEPDGQGEEGNGTAAGRKAQPAEGSR
jgi:hypothetical protein